MSFLEHLEELRSRLITCAFALIGGMIICWFFRDQILKFLLSPLYDAWRQVDGLDEPPPLNFTSMVEPFTAYLKLSAIGGLFVGAPVILYQLWKFIAPGLYPKEKRMALPFVFASTLLFVGGSMMAYSTVFPMGFRFFLEFAAGQEMTQAEAEIAVGEEETADFSEAPPDSPLYFDTDPDAGERVLLPPKEAERENPDLKNEKKNPAGLAARPKNGPPQEDRPSWFVSLMNFFFSEDCGNLAVEGSEDRRGAVFTIAWPRARCGALPESIRVRRDGELIYPVWQPVSSSPSETGDVQQFVATDFPPSNGIYSYVVKVPKNPKAHRLMPMLTIQEYLSLAIRMILAFGLVFELPILISFLSIAGIVNYRQLIHFFRYFIVLAFVASAVLTPPDAVSQLLLAVPLLLLYAVSIMVAYLFGEKPT